MLSNEFIIKIFNHILKSNEGSKIELIKFKDKSFLIDLNIIKISAQVASDGFLSSYQGNTHDTQIAIPISSIEYLIHKDKIKLYKNIKITGDIEIAKQLLVIFSNLHLNGIYNFSQSVAILPVINMVSWFIRSLKEQLNLIVNNATISVKEYLLYETQDLITQYEHDSFCDSVDELRHKIDMFEKKLLSLMVN